MSEQWAEGPELTVNVGMTDEEIRATAVMAASHAWAGLEQTAFNVGFRDEAIVTTAAKFAAFIRGGTP